MSVDPSPCEERRSRLEQFAPVYQFHEVHRIRVRAPRSRIYRSIKQVTAGEITLFQALTWIRRLGRPGPESILNAPSDEPILEVATRSGFLPLADDPHGGGIHATTVPTTSSRSNQDLSPTKGKIFATPASGLQVELKPA